MLHAKLNKFKTFPVLFLSNEILKLEGDFINPTKLPEFPEEINFNKSKLKKGLEQISNFAVSKYVMAELVNLKPLNILKSLVFTPLSVTKQILQAKSSVFEKNS